MDTLLSNAVQSIQIGIEDYEVKSDPDGFSDDFFNDIGPLRTFGLRIYETKTDISNPLQGKNTLIETYIT